MSEPSRRTIHYTELPDLPPGHLHQREWDFFRRELPRLFAEGNEGKVALVKGEEIIGLYPTWDSAIDAGYEKFQLESFMVHVIRIEEPLLRLSPACWPCPTKPSPSLPGPTLSEPSRRTVHYTELPDLPAGHLLEREWNFYRREVPRLLAEGHEGKFALLKGEEIIGLYPTWEAASGVGYQKFLLESFMVQPILTEEPLLRLSPYCWPCHT